MAQSKKNALIKDLHNFLNSTTVVGTWNHYLQIYIIYFTGKKNLVH